MFELVEEHRMLRDLVAKFVDQELMPLERQVLAREAKGGKVALTEEEEAPLLAKCKELGLWGLDVPEKYGGANLPTVALMAVNEELGRTCVPFIFPPDSPNLHMLMAVATEMAQDGLDNAMQTYGAMGVTNVRATSARHSQAPPLTPAYLVTASAM